MGISKLRSTFAVDYGNPMHWKELIIKHKKKILRKMNDRKLFLKRQMNLEYKISFRHNDDSVRLNFTISPESVICMTSWNGVSLPKKEFITCLLQS